MSVWPISARAKRAPSCVRTAPEPVEARIGSRPRHGRMPAVARSPEPPRESGRPVGGSSQEVCVLVAPPLRFYPETMWDEQSGSVTRAFDE